MRALLARRPAAALHCVAMALLAGCGDGGTVEALPPDAGPRGGLDSGVMATDGTTGVDAAVADAAEDSTTDGTMAVDSVATRDGPISDAATGGDAIGDAQLRDASPDAASACHARRDSGAGEGGTWGDAGTLSCPLASPGLPWPGVAGGPSAVVTGDFNRDGKIDLAAGSAQGTGPSCAGGCVTVLLANGDGTFKATTYPNAQAFSLVTGDFNADGIVDLAGLDVGTSIMLGNGDGTFRAPLTNPAGCAGDLAQGDFNHDGKLDLAVTDACFGGVHDGTSVMVMPGNGDGSFGAALRYQTGELNSVTVDDVDGDGNLDLLVAAWRDLDGGLDGQVAALLGHGDGTFQAPAEFPAGGPSPSTIASADFNADGHPDVVVTLGDTAVGVLLGRGDGTLGAAVLYPQAYAVSAVAIGDFNGDGRPDLALPGERLLLGRGDGTFAEGQTVQSWGSSPRSADIDGDGKLDLVLAALDGQPQSDGVVALLRGNGDGTFPPPQYPTGLASAHPVAAADFNGDSIPDLVVGDFQGEKVSVLLGSGGATFGAAIETAVPSIGSVLSAAAGDFDGDGLPDLVVVGQGGAHVLIGRGDGRFLPKAVYPAGLWPGQIVVADLNRDGLLDLAVAALGRGYSSPGSVSVLLGHGDGTFDAAVAFRTRPGARSMATADFNGDGAPDLVVGGYHTMGRYGGGTNWTVVLLGNGDGTLALVADLQTTQSGAASSPLSMVATDLNGDCFPDLAIPYTGVFLGNGDGTFQPGVPTPGVQGDVAAGDVNGDGVVDLVSVSAGVELVLGLGGGAFAAPVHYGPRGGSILVMDLNGDGKPEVAVPYYGAVSVLFADPTCAR